MVSLPFNYSYLYIYLGIGVACSGYFVIKAFIEYLNLSSYRKNFQTPQSFKHQLLAFLQSTLVYSVASLLCTVAWPVILIWSVIEKAQERQIKTRNRGPHFHCKKEYLIRKVIPEEAEQDSYIHDPLGMVPKVAFGHLNQAWCNFLAELEEGDELWLFEITKESISNKDYQRSTSRLLGYAQIRHTQIISEFVFESF